MLPNLAWNCLPGVLSAVAHSLRENGALRRTLAREGDRCRTLRYRAAAGYSVLQPLAKALPARCLEVRARQRSLSDGACGSRPTEHSRSKQWLACGSPTGVRQSAHGKPCRSSCEWRPILLDCARGSRPRDYPRWRRSPASGCPSGRRQAGPSRRPRGSCERWPSRGLLRAPFPDWARFRNFSVVQVNL